MYSYNKVSWRKKKCFSNCCKPPKYFSVFIEKMCNKWTCAVQIPVVQGPNVFPNFHKCYEDTQQNGAKDNMGSFNGKLREGLSLKG